MCGFTLGSALHLEVVLHAPSLELLELAIGEQRTGCPACKRGNEGAENGRGYIEREQEVFASLQEREAFRAEGRERGECAHQANADATRDGVRDMYAPVEPLINDIDDVAAYQIDEQRADRERFGGDRELDQIAQRCTDRAHCQNDGIEKSRGGHDLLARSARVVGRSALRLFAWGRHATILGERMCPARSKWAMMQKEGRRALAPSI